MQISFTVIEESSYGELCRLKCLKVSSPFVYTFLNQGVPVYIGKTCNIWSRINNHLNLDKMLSADSIIIEEMLSCVDMDLYELQMINKYKPFLNKATPSGELSGTVDITPKSVINIKLCRKTVDTYRIIRKVCDDLGFNVKVKDGAKRVYFKVSGKIAEKGKTYCVDYCYNKVKNELTLYRRSGRKVFDSSVEAAIKITGLFAED